MSNFTPQQIEEFLQEFFDVVGTRQYTGARYVPIFGRAGEDTVEWDDGAPYEPLTVVMHEGVSYVSRRYVPRGIQITDTAYWVETYRFNAQVEAYRQEVLSFQGQIDGLRQDMEDDYVPFPDPDHYPKYGTTGQVLSTLADGTTKWEDPVVPSDEQAEAVITEWLDDHPEATTTVQDNSVTDAKLVQSGGILSRALQWLGAVNRPLAQITTPGTYTVARSNSQTIGLPAGMVANYGTLIGMNSAGTEFFLFESTTPIRMWRYNANTWFRLTDSTLTGEGAAADAKETGDRIAAAAPIYKGMTADLEAAGTGYWTFARASVPAAQLPTGFIPNYGFLFKLNSPNTNDGYFAIQSNSYYPTMWFKYIDGWIQLTNRAESNINGKKIAFIGDSITEYNDTASYNYVKLFETYGGAVVQNLGVSGTGYCRHHENSQNFINRVASINADTDIIVVAGSFNDLGATEPLGTPSDTGSTTVCGYINAFYDALIAAFPTKPIFVYTMNYWSGFTTNPSRFLDYVEALRTICRNRAVSFVDVGEQCGIRPWDTSNATALCPDGTHPNNAGHRLMYPIIKNQIIKNTATFY